MPRVFLGLPAYNEAENLVPLVEHAVQVFQTAGLDGSIIAVNDGSTDATLRVLQELAAKHPVQVVNHEKNSGLGVATKSLINAALEKSADDEDILVCMDADNTHDPSLIPSMCQKVWDEKYDVVIASRYQEGSQEIGVPLMRRLLSRAGRYTFAIFLRLPEVRDYTCGYRAYRMGLLHAAVASYGENLITRSGFACTDELLVHLSRLTKRMTEVPFILRYDKKRGSSKLPLFRTVAETLKMLFFERR